MRRGTRIGLSIGAVVVLGLAAGGWYGTQMLKQKIGNEVVQTLNSPDTQKQIQKIIESNDFKSVLQSSVVKTASTNLDTANRTSAAAGIDGSANLMGKGNATRTQSIKEGVGQSNTGTDNKTGKPEGESKKSSSTSNDSPIEFQNRQQVIQFAMSRFSTQEITQLFAVWARRSSLSSEQKEQVKNEILSKFTPVELAAMMTAVNK